MLSSSTQIRQYEISDLPQEILPRIFKVLSTNERKIVKLVCKSWFEACNVFSLLNDELLTCLGIYQLSDTYELLNRSQRRFLSLKFECVEFNNYSSFWESNGYKIRSIDFINCNFLNGTLEKIILYCVNLIHLSFTYTTPFAVAYTASESPINENDLDEVLKTGIVRENLSSLKIYVGDPYRIKLSNYIIHQLFSIFPKVKILKIKCTDSSEDYSDEFPGNVDLNLSEFRNKNCFTFSPVLNYLIAATDRIEKLQLHFPCRQFPLNVLHPIFTAMKRLSELSINMGIFPLPEDMDALVLCSKQLKSLEFYLICVEKRPSYHTVLLQMLLSNSSFKYLKIRCRGPPLVVSKAVFEKLISSDLKNLNVSLQSISVENPDSFVPHLLAQNRPTVLPNLSLRLYDVGEDSLSFFSQNYRNLHHLELFGISDPVLELLFKYQLKLKSLIIGRSRNWWTIVQERLEIFRNAFNKLADIEYLDLSIPVGDIFVRCLSPEPILANLKYLNIEILDENQLAFTSDLLKAADAMPFLEALRIIHKQVVSFDFCVELCCKLSRLRYFFYLGDWLVGDRFCADENYRELFLICPSLRVLVHHNNVEDKTFFFDTINKEVILKEIDIGIDFSKPKVGNLSVAWLRLF